MSGSGKTTIANILTAKLLEVQDKTVSFLDGDVVRSHFTSELGFSREHRDLNVRCVGYMASEITKHGGIAVCALIAPYIKTRTYVKNLIEKHGIFIEVYISTPLELCEKRNVKGLYKKARKGMVKNFTGINDPYEPPIKPDIFIDTEKMNVIDCVSKIVDYLAMNNYINKK